MKKNNDRKQQQDKLKNRDRRRKLIDNAERLKRRNVKKTRKDSSARLRRKDKERLRSKNKGNWLNNRD